MGYMNVINQLIITALLIHCSFESENSCYWNDNVFMCSNVKNYEEIINLHSDPVHLYIFDSNIYEIEPGSLRYFSDLEQLWMPNNNITLLEAGSFNGLLNLEDLDLNSNNIETIRKGVFNGMYNLQFLDLSYNKIQTIDNNSFTGTDSLNDLYLNNNLISNMTALTGNCENLDLLDLSNNKLEELQFAKSCKKLRILNVANNNLSRLSGSDFSSAITSLDLSDNNIGYIKRFNLKKLDNLVQLNLSRNPLFEIHDMNVDLFQDRFLLKVLNLSSTSIKKLSVGVFSQMRLLEVLDLSSNNLAYLPNSIFYASESLKELYLGNNRLSYFHYDGSTLNKLDLNGNLWNCDSLSRIVKKFRMEVLRGDSYNTTNIYGIACFEETKDFGKAQTYNSSGISDLQKEYLSHLIKTQTDLREILKAFLEQSAQNIPDVKNILNETSYHLQGLQNTMRQRKSDEEKLLVNLTNIFSSLPKLADTLTTLKDTTNFEAKNNSAIKLLITETFGEGKLLANLTNVLASLPKLASELNSLKNGTDFRENHLQANNDDTIKQLIMELKNIILKLNNNFVSTKIDTPSAKPLERIQNETLKSNSSPVTNKSDTIALYCIVGILLAIFCLLIFKQHKKYKHSRISPDENNPLNSLVV